MFFLKHGVYNVRR